MNATIEEPQTQDEQEISPEMQAAMGLCNLNHIDTILAKRKAICEAYDQALFYKSSQNSENSQFRHFYLTWLCVSSGFSNSK